MKRITIRDVAREANVSVTLVSFVMNAKRDAEGNLICPVNADTAKRVLDVATKLGYKRNFAAASLRSGRSNTIAVIPNDISNKFFAGISRYIEDKAKALGYNVLFSSSEEDPNRLSGVLDAVMAHNVDGIIVAPCAGCEEIIARTLDYKVPIVLLDRDIDSIDGVGKVLLDDWEAGYLATSELLEQGYKKVEMISYSLGISSFSERESGYMGAMADRSLKTKAKIHHTTYAKAAEEVEKIILNGIERGVEAFFMPSYSLSAIVLSVLKKNNLRTPEDIAIVGFDESDVYRLYSTTITHIVQPLKILGEKSVEVLVEMIEGKAPEKILLSPELIRGGSSEKKTK